MQNTETKNRTKPYKTIQNHTRSYNSLQENYKFRSWKRSNNADFDKIVCGDTQKHLASTQQKRLDR